jgi:hypothetical protein
VEQDGVVAWTSQDDLEIADASGREEGLAGREVEVRTKLNMFTFMDYNPPQHGGGTRRGLLEW